MNKVQFSRKQWPKWMAQPWVDYSKFPSEFFQEGGHWYSRPKLPFWAWLYNKTVDRLSCKVQKLLFDWGVSIHNPIRGECTPDFSCCQKEWQGTEHEHILNAIAKAAANGEGVVKVQKQANEN